MPDLSASRLRPAVEKTNMTMTPKIVPTKTAANDVRMLTLFKFYCEECGGGAAIK